MRDFIRRWLGLPSEAEREAQRKQISELTEATQGALRILRSWDAKGVPSTRYEQL